MFDGVEIKRFSQYRFFQPENYCGFKNYFFHHLTKLDIRIIITTLKSASVDVSAVDGCRQKQLLVFEVSQW